MFVTQKKSKKRKEKKSLVPLTWYFLEISLTWIMGEKRSRITGDRITGELHAFMGEIKRQKRERVVSVLYHLSFDRASEGIFEIRKILEHRGKEKRREYKIWWKGYPRKEAMWVKEKDIHNNLVIKEYWKKNGKSNSSLPRLSQ